MGPPVVPTGARDVDLEALPQALLDEERLTPFDPRVPAQISPERIAGRLRGEYSLVYRLSDDGAAVTTRYLGPSSAISVGLRTVESEDAVSHRLAARLPGGEFTLARWSLDERGRVARAFVRRDPLIEIRFTKGHLDEPRVREWRPIVDGSEGGEWRRW